MVCGILMFMMSFGALNKPGVQEILDYLYTLSYQKHQSCSLPEISI